MHRYTLSNLLSWSLASLKLIVFMHYFTCGWLFINTKKLQYGVTNFHPFSDQESYRVRYFESWYLISTTISTVGYGDVSGFNNSELDSDWSVEMLYLHVVIIAGIILFSLVTSEIFSYKKMLKLSEIMRIKSQQMEILMYDISLRNKKEVLDRIFIDNAISGIKN